VSGAENGASGPKSKMSGDERESEKNKRNGKSDNGSGAVSGLDLPLMAAPLKPVVLCSGSIVLYPALLQSSEISQKVISGF